MSDGWHPDLELKDDLASLTARSPQVPPPSARRGPSQKSPLGDPQPAGVTDVDADTSDESRVEEPPASPPPAGEMIEVDRKSPERPSTRQHPQAADRAATGPRSTSAYLPVTVIKELTRRRLQAQADGSRLVVNTWIAEAIVALPTSPAALAKLVAVHREVLNQGLTRRDPGWVPLHNVGLRIPPDADALLDRGVLALYERDGTRVSRQDLITVAVLERLAARQS